MKVGAALWPGSPAHPQAHIPGFTSNVSLSGGSGPGPTPVTSPCLRVPSGLTRLPGELSKRFLGDGCCCPERPAADEINHFSILVCVTHSLPLRPHPSAPPGAHRGSPGARSKAPRCPQRPAARSHPRPPPRFMVPSTRTWPPPPRGCLISHKSVIIVIIPNKIFLLGALVPLIPAPVRPGKRDGSVQGGVKQAFSSLWLKSRRECGSEGGCHRVEARPAAARPCFGLGGGLWAPRSAPPTGPGGCPMRQDSQSFWARVPPQETQDFLFFSFYYST